MDNRDAILKTIDRIAQLSRQPGNEWLLRELAIDYTIDEIASYIDYSFVQSEVLRIKLESDWREMLRYRCGVRKHERDFYEFCRYANLQAEGVVNYYCYTKYPTEEELKTKCNDYKGEAVDNKDPRYYCMVMGENVTYNNKLNLIRVETKLASSVAYVLSQEIYQARNIQSHRSLLPNDKIEKLQAWIAKSPYDEVEKVLSTLVITIKNALLNK